MNKPSRSSSNEGAIVRAGARSSPLSRAQVSEIQQALCAFHPHITLEPTWVETTGDIDQTTSLRLLDKTDFFTKEIDALVLQGQCRIGIHSAKDLPSPLPEGLELAAVTQGIDPADALVFREGESLHTLPEGAVVATSSQRREEAVRRLRPDLEFIDLRGNIQQRLALLQQGRADAIVAAEAALIRLGLTHLPRYILPGETTPGQGRLAVVARKEDIEIRQLFAPIDARQKALYLGLQCPQDDLFHTYTHYPMIEIRPRNFRSPDMEEKFTALPGCTHLLFTSQTGVRLFFEALPDFFTSHNVLETKTFVAVGQKTAAALYAKGFQVEIIPEEETAEGIIREFEVRLALKPVQETRRDLHFFWPRSSLSRPVLNDYFFLKKIPLTDVILYDTLSKWTRPAPCLDNFDQIVFTSPSTVRAFLECYGSFPKNCRLQTIGPVTSKYLSSS